MNLASEWAAFAGELTTEIHEVLGHGSGRMAEGVLKLMEDAGLKVLANGRNYRPLSRDPRFELLIALAGPGKGHRDPGKVGALQPSMPIGRSRRPWRRR